MFGHRYFGARYYGPRYWGDGDDTAPVVPDSPSIRGTATVPSVAGSASVTTAVTGTATVPSVLGTAIVE